ncbi:MAG: response regulator [Ornithinimicrobium sp.]|uniref:response regulator n=1 Tax=Ornithinimicrobium sp. TaxID=1977084 RepID=UPI003D9B1A8C
MSEVSAVDVIRVVLVDDDALVRTGLRLILGGAEDIEVVGEAQDGRAGVELVARHTPDVVLMDIRLPRLDGIAATREVLAADSGAKAIVLTTFDTDEMVVEALRTGARGFLLKSTRPERLVEGIRAVAAGEPMLSPSVTAQLINRVTSPRDTADPGQHPAQDAARSRLEDLTEREREVAIAVAQGLSNSQIALLVHDAGLISPAD